MFLSGAEWNVPMPAISKIGYYFSFFFIMPFLEYDGQRTALHHGLIFGRNQFTDTPAKVSKQQFGFKCIAEVWSVQQVK